MKWPKETLQNLPYFLENPHSFFHVSFRATFRPGHSLGKKKFQEMKNEKKYMGFRIPKICMANFEAFC